MNMLTVLLGSTGVLLLVVLGVSMVDMSNGATPEKVAELEQELLALEAEEAELRQQRARQLVGAASMPITPSPIIPVTPVPSTTPVGTLIESTQELEDLKVELAERDRQIAELATENAVAEKKVEIATEEAEWALEHSVERQNQDRARARFIKDAIMMARVTEWSPENGFAVIEVLRPDLVDLNTELGIRRNSGIAGRLQISQMYEGGKAIADPVPGTFPGGVSVMPGDELIVPE